MANQQLSGVPDTLFIPLAARVAISRRFPDYFYDPKALELENLPAIQRILQKSSEYSAVASVARCYNFDALCRAFAAEHGRANVINLGCGLETINCRVNAPELSFYSVDFPKVIELRGQILGRSPNESFIACDITDMAWTKQLDPARPSFLIVAGVFQYFTREAVLKFIRDVQKIFPCAELIFDATNEVGLRYANRYVRKTGNTDALMHFYVNDPAAFAREAGVTLIECRGFFDAARRLIGKKTRLYTRLAMKVADDKKRTLILHLKL